MSSTDREQGQNAAAALGASLNSAAPGDAIACAALPAVPNPFAPMGRHYASTTASDGQRRTSICLAFDGSTTSTVGAHAHASVNSAIGDFSTTSTAWHFAAERSATTPNPPASTTATLPATDHGGSPATAAATSDSTQPSSASSLVPKIAPPATPLGAKFGRSLPDPLPDFDWDGWDEPFGAGVGSDARPGLPPSMALGRSMGTAPYLLPPPLMAPPPAVDADSSFGDDADA
eukprot:CAMPEP_0174827818 /NCGR_PEP_ID=MMETSP1114-20130205/941_1 /TAXON_ID=312471 /ORGANISM="Neobodo designis, Strain CCAP 1951/1" /LENGTH=231 /DNA_ID=CAMNT_0016061497 /DNA_START=160 /DNA_END=855 /DNA_ORIENTATION=-